MDNKLSEEEMMNHIKRSSEKKQPQKEEVKMVNESFKRNVIIMGVGDGGGNIASEIKKETKAKTIIYNTAKRNILERLKMDDFIHPNSEDGSGKEREYSKNVFKERHESIKNTILKYTGNPHTYNIVTTTADGGTGGGSSPNIAKYIESVTGNDTMIIGVYPSLKEDALGHYNTLKWQEEVSKIEIPYMVFDNNKYSNLPTLEMYDKVNDEIKHAVGVFAGIYYSESETLDNRDFNKLVAHGGRVNIYDSTSIPKVEQSLDDFLENLIKSSSQPEPLNARAYGLFIKGRRDFIDNLDLSLSGLMETYGGISRSVHIEYSEINRISLIITGSSEPETRLVQIKRRSQDMADKVVDKKSIVSDLLSDMKNPSVNKNIKKISAQDALDI